MIPKSKPSYVRVCSFTDSSAISEAAYDFSRRTLKITFLHTESIWEYYNVYPSDFAALCCAYSPGEVFNERIRNRFDAKRLHPPPESEQIALTFNKPG